MCSSLLVSCAVWAVCYILCFVIPMLCMLIHELYTMLYALMGFKAVDLSRQAGTERIQDALLELPRNFPFLRPGCPIIQL